MELCVDSMESRIFVIESMVFGRSANICGIRASSLSRSLTVCPKSSDMRSISSSRSNIDRNDEHTGMSKQCFSQ